MIDVTVATTASETWSTPQLLTVFGAEGRIMRGPSTGAFPTARPLWTRTTSWLREPVRSWEAADGYRELIRRWLFSFGPGTEDDIVWWLGATKGVVRIALSELDASRVTLEGPATGWLLPDDLDEVTDPEPWTALLPSLDPTVRGWKNRDFYLGPHHHALFDTRGNAGATAWIDGRIVGTWVQPSRATRTYDDRGSRRIEHTGTTLDGMAGQRPLPTGYL